MTQFFMPSWTCWSAAAVGAVLLSACGKGQQAAAPVAAATPAPAPVATVNGTPISRADYDFYLNTLLAGKKPPAELTAEQKNQILDELVSMQLIGTQAQKDGLDKQPDVAARLEITRLRLMADAGSQKYLKGKEPTDQELHAEYDSQTAAMDKTEYHARHILVPAKELADQLTKRIKGGAKFEDLAKANSIDGSKTNGGDLGWFTPARMVKPFADAVKALKKGEVTADPVQTQFGWHIIKLEDTREVAPPPFEKVKEQVSNFVVQKKLQAYAEELKKTAKIDKSL
jgi:peptidyl-prolyl cis-trans isomerase C